MCCFSNSDGPMALLDLAVLLLNSSQAEQLMRQAASEQRRRAAPMPSKQQMPRERGRNLKGCVARVAPNAQVFRLGWSWAGDVRFGDIETCRRECSEPKGKLGSLYEAFACSLSLDGWRKAP